MIAHGCSLTALFRTDYTVSRMKPTDQILFNPLDAMRG